MAPFRRSGSDITGDAEENRKNGVIRELPQDSRAGHFGPFGGRFIPEALVPGLDELTAAYLSARADPERAVGACRRGANPAARNGVRGLLGGTTPAEPLSVARMGLLGAEVVPVNTGCGMLQAATATFAGGSPGVLHGIRSYLLQDSAARPRPRIQSVPGWTIQRSAQSTWVRETGRADYLVVDDAEAMTRFALLANSEGILPAIAPSEAGSGILCGSLFPALIGRVPSSTNKSGWGAFRDRLFRGFYAPLPCRRRLVSER